ncbi:hypothetical protein QTP88_014224 [Uroleucon formosanum]
MLFLLGQQKEKSSIFCAVCLSTFSCEMKGFQAITQHVSTKFHQNNAKCKLDSTQLRLIRTHDSAPVSSYSYTEQPIQSSSTSALPISSNVGLRCIKDEAIRAELLWTMKCVWSNYSASSCDGIVNIFKVMFPKGIPDEFSLGKKHEEKIVFKHLETFFIGKATGDILADNLLNALKNADLPLTKLLMLTRDGPNVNKKVQSIINEVVQKKRGTSLLDIGSCNLHIVHNAFRKGLETFGADVRDMLITVNSFFDGWPSRQEAFLDAQIKVNVPQHCFVKHITFRWFTLSTATKRLQEKWPALEQFFLRDIPKSATPNKKKIVQTAQFKSISNHLKNSFMRAEVAFVIESAAILERFLIIFQKDEPLIHILFEEVIELTATVLGRVCKPDVLLDLNNVNSNFISSNLLPTNRIKFGDNTEKNILKIKDLNQLQFKTNARDHFIAAATHLLNKTIIASSATTKHFKCLKPEERKEEKSIRGITRVARLLPLKVSETALSDDWLLLQLESNLITTSNNSSRIDCYWNNIFNIKNAINECKYPLITKVVRAVLYFSHGNASVEREISISGQIITPDKVRMKVKTLNAKLNIKSVLRAYGGKAELIPITRELLIEAHFAYRKYKSNLEEEKRTAEKKI